MRYYSSIAVDTALTDPVNSSTLEIPVTAIVGYPVSTPFTIVIDPDTLSEELCEVQSYEGAVFTVTRGFDSTTAVSHNVGATVKHVISAEDLREPQEHIAATENVHGIADTAFLVTTNGTQALTNKDLSSGTNTFPTSLVTLTGSQSLTNKDLTSGTNTFPSSLVTESGTQTLTNKTIDYNDNTITNLPSVLPSQGGNAGKYLTTDGSTPSWATVSSGSSDGFTPSFLLGGM